jgi:hypothetical protein
MGSGSLSIIQDRWEQSPGSEENNHAPEDVLDVLAPAPQHYPRYLFHIESAHDPNELYLAAGYAAQNMLQLETMVFEAHIQAPPFGLENITIGTACHWFMYKRSKSQAT